MIPERSSFVTLRRATGVAGVCYVAVIVLGVAQAALVSSRFPDRGDPEAVVAALLTGIRLFRLGVLGDIALYAFVLVLAVALYVVVRDIHRPLALGGLVLRSAEAVTGLSATIVGGLAPLRILTTPTGADPSAVLALLAVRESALDVILVLVGLGGAAFCALFFRARLIAAPLALWGVLTYVSMIVLGGAGILWPGLPSSVTTTLFAQGALFELLFGLLLVFRAGEIGTRAGAAGAT